MSWKARRVLRIRTILKWYGSNMDGYFRSNWKILIGGSTVYQSFLAPLVPSLEITPPTPEARKRKRSNSGSAEKSKPTSQQRKSKKSSTELRPEKPQLTLDEHVQEDSFTMFDEYGTMCFDDPIAGQMTFLPGPMIPPAILKEAPKASEAQVVLPPPPTTGAAPPK